MRRFFFLLLLLLLSGPATAVAPVPEMTALLPDSETRWVPFTLTPGNQIRFTAFVDGQPVSAILDTGASNSILSRAFTDRTGRKVSAQGQVTAIGGMVPLGWVAIRSLAFGGLERTGGGLNVVTLPGNVTGNAGGIELLVGRDLTEKFALDLDYGGRRFRLLRSGRLPFAGTRAPLGIGRAPLAYITELSIAGRRLRPIIVDTGDGSAVTLSRAYGVGGPIEADIAILPKLTIGDREARDVGTWVEASGGFSDAAGIAGRIGMGFLQRYRVLLDPGAGRMILADNPDLELPPRSTSGLQLALTGERFRVLHVMRGSPAEAAGWPGSRPRPRR